MEPLGSSLKLTWLCAAPVEKDQSLGSGVDGHRDGVPIGSLEVPFWDYLIGV